MKSHSGTKFGYMLTKKQTYGLTISIWKSLITSFLFLRLSDVNGSHKTMKPCSRDLIKK